VIGLSIVFRPRRQRPNDIVIGMYLVLSLSKGEKFGPVVESSGRNFLVDVLSTLVKFLRIQEESPWRTAERLVLFSRHYSPPLFTGSLFPRILLHPLAIPVPRNQSVLMCLTFPPFSPW